jgi:hypothetical protein
MYDLTINIETEQSGLSFVPTGIQENLRLAKPDGTYPITYEKSKGNSEFIAFNFLNEEGQTFVHTEWLPKSDDPSILSKKEANLVKRLLHIGRKLVDANAFKQIKTESFELLAKSYINIIGNNYKGKLFRGKIVYNNKNFTTFPNYVPFLELMSVPKEESNLKMSNDDKVVKTKADVIQSRPNPFTEDITEPDPIGPVDANNLPF